MKSNEHLRVSESVQWECGFTKKRTLRRGKNYQLRRKSDNPKDTYCFTARKKINPLSRVYHDGFIFIRFILISILDYY